VRQFNFILAIVLSYASLVGYLVTPLSAEEVHTYGPIKTGDMLWTIAAKVSPPSVNRHQVILALQRSNPHAFSVPCNVNSLKVGETLRIPSLTEMQTFTPEKAIKELDRQNEEWQNRHNKSIVCPPITPPPTEKTSSPTTEKLKQTSVSEPAEPKTTSSPTTQSGAVTTAQSDQVPPAADSTTTMNNATPAPTQEIPPPASPTTPSVSPQPTTTNPVATPNNQLALVPETVESGDIEAESQPLSPTIPITKEPSKPENPYVYSPKLIAMLTIAAIILILLFMGLRKKSVKRKLANTEKLENYTFTEPIEEMPLQFEQHDKPSS
jgi:FimV-like protein